MNFPVPGLPINACKLASFLMTAEIVKRTENERVEVHHLDLSSLASVRKFANNIIKTEPSVDILINNAGTTGLGNKHTADNLQIGMQVNHFGPFLLTCLLVGKSKSIRRVFHSELWVPWTRQTCKAYLM
jgi:NAD(P)-dependent dehydrogenase (short-subunit alcohol dehydrogenase family)